MSHSLRDLEALGFVSIPYPATIRNGVEETARTWKKFCSLPEEVKRGLPYSSNADGVGYELKKGDGPKGDRKENFDLTTGSKEWLEENAQQLGNPITADFVKDATKLAEEVAPLVIDFANKAEKEFGLEGFAREVEESKDSFFIRFIHYFGSTAAGEEIASAHADQSGFTLHLFESDKGLQCLTFENEWVDMPVSDGQTVIIPSMQMQLRSKGRLKALSHRVVATPETATTGRFSAVCFVQLKDTPKYDKAAQGRLQEKTPGFNYQMTHDDFKKLFMWTDSLSQL